MKNISLKIFSIFIAVMIWLYVNSEANESVIALSVPIELKGMPDQKIVVAPALRQAQVSIKGPSFLLSQIYSSPPAFRFKLPADLSNKYTVPLNRADLALPPSVSIVSIEPSEMVFAFDDLVSKELPVKIITLGSVKEGHKVQEIKSEPETINISGPKMEVDKLTVAESEPLDLREISQDTVREVNLRQLNKISDVSSNKVKAVVKVISENTEKKYLALSIEKRSVDGDIIKLVPDKVNVEITAQKDKIVKFRDNEIIPYVRIDEQSTAEGDLEVSVQLPKGAELINVEPKFVKFYKGQRKAEPKRK